MDKNRGIELRPPFSEPGYLVGLVAQGRIPDFIPATSGPQRRLSLDFTSGRPKPVYTPIPGTIEKIVFCVVPPEGTQAGDSFKRVFGPTIAEVVSPDGESKGICETFTLTPEEAREIREQIIALSQ